MGYRNYIGVISKDKYNQLKDLTIDELTDQKGDDVDVYDLVERLYNFGSGCRFNHPKESLKPFFAREETQGHLESDAELKLTGKDFLEHVINWYTKEVKDYYLELISGIDSNDKTTWTDEKFAFLFKNVQNKALEWNSVGTYDLNDGPEITNSWSYEYVVFELVRIYKSFDWEKNVLVYYGY